MKKLLTIVCFFALVSCKKSNNTTDIPIDVPTAIVGKWANTGTTTATYYTAGSQVFTETIAGQPINQQSSFYYLFSADGRAGVFGYYKYQGYVSLADGSTYTLANNNKILNFMQPGASVAVFEISFTDANNLVITQDLHGTNISYSDYKNIHGYADELVSTSNYTRF